MIQGMLSDNLKNFINVSISLITKYITYIKFSYLLIYGDFRSNMKDNTSKRKLRIENKHKKMAALLNISKLNEYDRKKSEMARIEASCQTESIIKSETEPSPKRLKTGTSEEEAESESPPQIVIGASGKPKLSGPEFIELKKMLRERTGKIRNQPAFRLRDMGENASLKVETDNRVPLFLSDLQHLIMYSQIGAHSPYSPARWCALEKYNKLLNVNLLIVENVSLYHFVSHESQFPFLSSKFETKLEILPPNSYKSDIVKDLSMVPLTATQMRKFKDSFGTLEEAVTKTNELFDTVKHFFPIETLKSAVEDAVSENTLPKTDKFSRTLLLLSGWQMVEENFPLPIKGLMERKYSDYVLSKDKYKDATPFSPMFAIDCEMCRTSTGGLELTRISVVNEKLEVFYDTLVKPDNQIIDYLTRFSGITPKMMKKATKKLKDVQNELREQLPEDAILVGQSLGNDLHAMKMMHPYIIDTSVIYNITGDRTRKTKLQTLSREFLSEKIQIGNKGHCSTEDSLACMKLTQLKLSKHLYFGDAVMGSVHSDTRAYPDIGSSNFATSMLRQCTKVDKSARVIAVNEISEKYKYFVDKGAEGKEFKKISCVSETSNKLVMKKMCDSLSEYSLNIGHIRITENQLENGNCKSFKNIDKWIKELYEKTNTPSLLVVLFGGQKEGGTGSCFIQLKREFF